MLGPGDPGRATPCHTHAYPSTLYAQGTELEGLELYDLPLSQKQKQSGLTQFPGTFFSQACNHFLTSLPSL